MKSSNFSPNLGLRSGQRRAATCDWTPCLPLIPPAPLNGLPVGCQSAASGLPVGCQWAASLLPVGCQSAASLLPVGGQSAASLLPVGCQWAASLLPVGCQSAASGLPVGCQSAASVLPVGCQSAASLLPVGCQWAASLLPVCCQWFGDVHLTGGGEQDPPEVLRVSIQILVSRTMQKQTEAVEMVPTLWAAAHQTPPTPECSSSEPLT
ncbi:unnamed protein product, partial [Menidia menidia]